MPNTRRTHQEHVGDNVGEGEGDEGHDGEEDAEDFADDVLGCGGLPDAQAHHPVAEERAQDLLPKGCAGLAGCDGNGVPCSCCVGEQEGLRIKT